MKFLRLGVITVVVVALLGLSAVNLDARRSTADDNAEERRLGYLTEGVTADPADTLDSSWYCTAPRIRESTMSRHEIVVANGSNASVSIVVRASALRPKSSTTNLRAVMDPSTVRVINVDEISPDSPAAVTVEARGGEVTVSHRLSGGFGTSQVPCGNRPASTWYFPYLNTEKDATARMYLYNPYPVSTAVDIELSTSDYVRSASQLTGVGVPAHGVVALNLNAAAVRRDALSVSVRTRSGSVLAEAVQTFGAGNLRFNQTRGEGKKRKFDKEALGEQALPRRGVAIVEGSPERATASALVDGFTQGGIIELYAIYNPSDDNVDASLLVTPYGEDRGVYEPYEKTLLTGRAEQVRLDNDQRIPEGGFHDAIVVADRPVAAARVAVAIGGRPESDKQAQIRPVTSKGASISPASSLTARRWWSMGMGLDVDDEGWLLVSNPTKRAGKMTVIVHGGGTADPAPGLKDLALPAGGRVAVDVADLKLQGVSVIEVRSTVPTQVDQRVVDASADDFTSVPAVPESSGVRPLDDVLDLG